ncbi:MAG: family 43 glycosylhydrolase [Tannerella sp.]|jgi:arabinan endo-1,5-alpha-L-arabinosidase|nr:family 43 glycosylhydrolase [Tannerella sp.]
MKKYLLIIAVTAVALLCLSCCKKSTCVTVKYENPVIRHNCADPTVIDDRARTGYFYVYSTQNGISEAEGCVYLPVYKSTDLVNWEFVSDGFGTGRPQWEPGSRIWAPDINYINGKYVIYYALGIWGDLERSASGVAVSDKPEGPFVDVGMIVNYATTGVSNSIDPNFYDDGDTKYLYWGSLGKESGIWVIELTDDGLHVKEGAIPLKLGGTRFEGAYMHKRGNYYYLFASAGACCNGRESTYHIVVGRSDNPLGPFVDPDGNVMSEDSYDYTVIHNPDDLIFAGPGHNAEIITDDAGQDWMPYHGYWAGNAYDGRCMLIDQVKWTENGWPYFKGKIPSVGSNAPEWRK